MSRNIVTPQNITEQRGAVDAISVARPLPKVASDLPDSEVVTTMRAAFERALTDLPPYLWTERTKSRMARAVVRSVKAGLRDPDRLTDIAHAAVLGMTNERAGFVWPNSAAPAPNDN